ncbi:tissue alpha-L-fucosidase [Thozetella sp. PMI_491]|nr:tissue alpha-L-fucosidase [Thozetella sp. PMI_491]
MSCLLDPVPFVQLDLAPYFNNKAFGKYPGEASFDTTHRSYPIPNDLAPDGIYTSSLTGLSYAFPGYTGAKGQLDNVICTGQSITVPEGNYFSVSMLVASDVPRTTVSDAVEFTYTSNGAKTVVAEELRAPPAWTWTILTRGEIVLPFGYTADGVDYNTSQIFEWTSAVRPGDNLQSITLPNTTDADSGRIHVFAISLWQGHEVNIQSVRPTQKSTEAGNQVVEITINNAGRECVAGKGLKVSIEGCGIKTVEGGLVKRLCPGDQKRVNIGVTGTCSGGSVYAILGDDSHKQSTEFADMKIAIEDYTSDLSSVEKHESPQWFDDAKFGIFIHWGPYSVPAWGNSSDHETYAEWFWWYTNSHFIGADKSDDYSYRLRTYGPDWVYDDTFPEFKAEKFDPKEWLDLFTDAGAKYFVFTTKHHDGFALFDTGATSNRSSLHYGPKRDLLRELFDASAQYYPDLKRGTYFSLPEWYNPDFGPYGFVESDDPASVSWLGMLATNPYTDEVEPYTGHIPVNDYITDLQVPQMESLAYEYETEIMWCDISAANGTAAFAAQWWNKARQAGRQVVMNSRCGVPQATDYETPEYTTYSSAQLRKWESSRGLDPFSYGYNRATPDEDYMDAKSVITSLVDIVAKNGNLLIDVGPRADGTIPEIQAKILREAGAWIRKHGEAIYDTAYWFVQTQISTPDAEIRFTQTQDAFYILFLEDPVVVDGFVIVDAAVPILENDIVSLVGVEGAGSLAWKWTASGGLAIEVSAEKIAQDEYCWVFKIAYQ